MNLLQIEHAADAVDEHTTSAWDVGWWCWFNDQLCPYTNDLDRMEWEAGYNFAASREGIGA